MHHSRISTLMIDCLDHAFEDSLAFWGSALGLRPARRPGPSQRYVTLGRIQGPLNVRLQRVEKDPGFHLDVESDSVSGEATRLKRAGARRKYRVRSWWVLEDPSGNPFCVIRPESPEFPRGTAAWD